MYILIFQPPLLFDHGLFVDCDFCVTKYNVLHNKFSEMCVKNPFFKHIQTS